VLVGHDEENVGLRGKSGRAQEGEGEGAKDKGFHGETKSGWG
jgi:hypothetical protein